MELLADFDLNFTYVWGEDNTVADALSRKEIPEEAPSITLQDVACVAALTELGTMLSDCLRRRIVSGYNKDAFCVSLRKNLPLQNDSTERDGLLFIDDRLVIPATDDIRQSLMDEAHSRLGHLGYLKTINELRRDFFWPKMAGEVLQFVESCTVCQRTKAPTTCPTGRMLTPHFPRKPLVNIAIDFIGPLKGSQHYDMILSCTCRLSGFTKLIPTVQKDAAKKTASWFFSGWISYFGAPASIIGDRDKIWTAKFWRALMERLSVKFHMTTSFHPQADGRSKQTNQTVSQILRTFTSKHQGKWLDALPAVELAINSAVNVATGITPFNLIFGRRPPAFSSPTQEDNAPPALTKWI